MSAPRRPLGSSSASASRPDRGAASARLAPRAPAESGGTASRVGRARPRPRRGRPAGGAAPAARRPRRTGRRHAVPGQAAPALGPHRPGRRRRGHRARPARRRRRSTATPRRLDKDLKRDRPVLRDHRRPAGEDRRRRAQHPAGRQRLPRPGRPTTAGQRVARRHADHDAHPGRPRHGVPRLDPARPVGARSRQSNDAACDSGSRAKINASFAFGGLPLRGPDRRVHHRRAHGPRDGDRLRRLQGGHRRARRRRPEGRADRSPRSTSRTASSRRAPCT